MKIRFPSKLITAASSCCVADLGTFVQSVHKVKKQPF